MNGLFPVWFILLLWVSGGVVARAASEVVPIPSLNEGYVLRAWESEREAHYPAIQCIAQSKDGYLWAGSYNGMIRFDGRRFAPFDPQALDSGLGMSVSSLHAQAPHFLWIGTDSGLARLGPAGVEAFAKDKGVPKGRTHSILQVSGGQVLASVGKVILRLVGDRFQEESVPQGQLGKEWTLVEDVAGTVYAWCPTAVLRREKFGWVVVLEVSPNAVLQGVDAGRSPGLWMADDIGVWHWDRDVVTARQPRPEGFRGDRVHLYEDGSGLLWLGCFTQGLVVLGPEGARWKATSQDGLPNTSITCLKQDREGNVWIGSNGGGLVQVQRRTFRVYSSKDGLDQVVVNSMAELGDGSVLVGSHGGGAQVLKNGRFGAPIQLDQRSRRKWVHAVVSDGEGGAWIGTVGDGLFRWKDGSVLRRIAATDFGSDNVDGLLLDSKRRLWIGGSGSTAVLEAGRVRVLGATDGLPAIPQRTLGIEQTKDGTIWILLLDAGLFRWRPGAPGFEPVEFAAGPRGFRPERLYADSEGGLWLGGLLPFLGRFQDGGIRWFTPDDGVPVDGVYSMIEDGAGGLWLGGSDAIGRITMESAKRLLAGGAGFLDRWRFGAADGVKIPTGREFPFPSALRGRDGRLWFATLNGVAVTDPVRLRAHRTNGPPIFESIGRSDGSEELIWGELAGVKRFPAGTRDLWVRYTAAFLGDPESVEFEYRVERPGAKWLPGAENRSVLMTDLSAGDHSVAVRSRLIGDPVWSEPVVMHFEVGWFWWERPGVRWTGVVAGLLLVAFGMWWRLERHYQRKRTALAGEIELKRMAQAKEAAESANRAKTEFIAMISHELRTPLHGLLGHVDLLRDATLTSVQTGYLQTVRQSGESLLRVINEVLDYSRLETGRLDLDAEAFVLRRHLEAALDLVAMSAGARGLQFVCRLDPALPEVVVADSLRIHQVLVNLAGNAIKFTSSGHVWVNVDACAGRPGWAEFRVEDSGIGIALEDQGRLFQKFVQVDASTTRRFGGTGLGLAICKGLVDRMGGEIGCRSEPGKGSTFWFRIPLPEGRLVEAGGARDALPWRLHEHALVGMDEVTAAAVGAWVASTGSRVKGERHPDLVSVENWLRQPGIGMDGEATVFLGWKAVEGDPRFAIRSLRNATRRSGVRLVVLLGPVSAGEAEASEWGCDYVWRQPYLGMPVPVSAASAAAPSKAVGGLQIPAEPRDVPVVAVRKGAASPVRGVGDGSPVARKRVLLVEDHPVNQAYAKEALSSLGCLVDLANNGREAVELTRRGTYDLILMDCQMPELDGWEATRQIRASERSGQRQYIVALTAGAFDGDRERCLASGMDEFLTKPFRIADLKRLVERGR